jgi:hypothetical protein
MTHQGQIERIEGCATAFLRGLQLEAALGHGHGEDGHLPGLAMNLQMKPVFEQRPHHGSAHHGLALRTLCFGVDEIAGGIDPVRAFDRHQSKDGVQRVDLSIRKQIVGLLDETAHGPAR